VPLNAYLLPPEPLPPCIRSFGIFTGTSRQRAGTCRFTAKRIKGFPLKALERYIPFVGRILIALPLLNFSTYKFSNWDMMIEWIGFIGVPGPSIALGLSIMIEFVAAIMLIVGFKTRWAAIVLAAYLVPVTIMAHNFWTLEGVARQGGIESFGKGVMIIGGLLFVFAFGSGPISIDNRKNSAEA